ncbi:LysR family transcriptional regulator [Nocardia arthritidis]|nr:LysR family transcriptional regulator [Nocardia arthritidis]
MLIPSYEPNVLPIPNSANGIELRHLRAFVAVAEELNFGRAARRLHITQPALSRQIRALERQLGCELVYRNSHTVRPTLAGEVFREWSNRLLAEFDEAITATRSVGGELAARTRRMWEPVESLLDVCTDRATFRAAFEDMQAELPKAALLLCPGTGLYGRDAPTPGDRGVHEQLQAGYLGEASLDDPIANPTVADLSGLPPLLIQVAEHDAYGAGGHALAEQARAAGVPTRLEVYPVPAHAFQVFWSLLPDADDALRNAGRFASDPAALTA